MYKEIHREGIDAKASAKGVIELLHTWRNAKGDRDMPDLTEVNLVKLAQHQKNMMKLMPIGNGHYMYLHYGSAIADVAGFDMTGKTTTDFISDVSSFYRACYDEVLRDKQPLLTLHRTNSGKAGSLWERLIVPVRAGDAVMLLVHNSPRSSQFDLIDAVLNASQDGIMCLSTVRDMNGKPIDATIRLVNLAAGQITGRSVTELQDKGLLKCFPGNVAAGTWDRYVRVIEERVTDRFELHYVADGLDHWFRVTATPLGDGFTMTFTDITEMKNALAAVERQRIEYMYQCTVMEEQGARLSGMIAEAELAKEALRQEITRREELEGVLIRQATTDTLTGVLNRGGFEEQARKAFATARRHKVPVSVIAVDLDHFKRINDTYGHGAGDAVLKHTAAALSGAIREDVDIIGRTGGEEFLIVLPHIDTAGAMLLAERLRATIAASPARFEGVEGGIALTASFGVASIAQDDDSHEDMARRADTALYAAKRAGRDRVVASNARPNGLVAIAA
jgi:diguanylate cyclase (GGDEF)-like protein/PAS domain S-box-containing protein